MHPTPAAICPWTTSFLLAVYSKELFGTRGVNFEISKNLITFGDWLEAWLEVVGHDYIGNLCFPCL